MELYNLSHGTSPPSHIYPQIALLCPSAHMSGVLIHLPGRLYHTVHAELLLARAHSLELPSIPGQPRVLRTPWEFDLPIDYTCAYGRFQLYPRGVTILNGHYFSSSETEVIVTFKTVIILVYLVIVIKS
jgi:hypothetical protein